MTIKVTSRSDITIKVKDKLLLPTLCPITLTIMKESKSLVKLQTHAILGNILIIYLFGDTEGCQFQVKSKAGKSSVAGSCSSESCPVFLPHGLANKILVYVTLLIKNHV